MKARINLIGLAGCLALFLPLCFAYFQKSGEKPEGDLIVDCNQWIGDKMVGRKYEVVFVLDNPSKRQKRFLSAVYNCTPFGCVGRAQNANDEFVIPPGEKVDLPVSFSLSKAGPFEFVLPIFVEDGGVRTFNLTIKGDAFSTE